MRMISVLIVSFLLFSCSKKESCWTCKITVRETIGGIGNPSVGTATTHKEFCQKTEEDIKVMEEEGSFTTTATRGGVQYTIRTTTSCSKSNPNGVIPNDRNKR